MVTDGGKWMVSKVTDHLEICTRQINVHHLIMASIEKKNESSE